MDTTEKLISCIWTLKHWQFDIYCIVHSTPCENIIYSKHNILSWKYWMWQWAIIEALHSMEVRMQVWFFDITGVRVRCLTKEVWTTALFSRIVCLWLVFILCDSCANSIFLFQMRGTWLNLFDWPTLGLIAFLFRDIWSETMASLWLCSIIWLFLCYLCIRHSPRYWVWDGVQKKLAFSRFQMESSRHVFG